MSALDQQFDHFRQRRISGDEQHAAARFKVLQEHVTDAQRPSGREAGGEGQRVHSSTPSRLSWTGRLTGALCRLDRTRRRSFLPVAACSAFPFMKANHRFEGGRAPLWRRWRERVEHAARNSAAGEGSSSCTGRRGFCHDLCSSQLALSESLSKPGPTPHREFREPTSHEREGGCPAR